MKSLRRSCRERFKSFVLMSSRQPCSALLTELASHSAKALSLVFAGDTQLFSGSGCCSGRSGISRIAAGSGSQRTLVEGCGKSLSQGRVVTALRLIQAA